MQEAIRAVVDRIRDGHNARAPAKAGKAATHPLLMALGVVLTIFALAQIAQHARDLVQ